MDYYENKSTKQIFISLDEGETLINPTGKKIPCNDNLFEELEDEAPITEAQKKVAEVTEAFTEKREAFDIEHEQKNTKISYEGCKMSLRDKLDIEEGKKVINICADKRNTYELISTENLDEEAIQAIKDRFSNYKKWKAAERLRKQEESMDRLHGLIDVLLNR